MSEPVVPLSPPVRMVVCSDGRPCRIRVVFTPTLTERESQEVVDAAILERDRNCVRRPHRAVEYAPTASAPIAKPENVRVWRWKHLDGSFCEWEIPGWAAEKDVRAFARFLDKIGDCGPHSATPPEEIR